MLPKNLRLTKNSAFKATYNLRNTAGDSLFTLFAGKKKKDNETPTRVGFVVSKKNHKRAVKRNRLKRLMREAFWSALKDNELKNIQANMSIILVAKNNAIGKDFHTIKSSILKLASKIKNN